MRSPLLALSLITLGGCTMGPDYQGPERAGAVSPSAQFARSHLGVRAEAPALSPWWESLNDGLLSELVTEALAQNPRLDIAKARLAQSRASLRNAKANMAPALGANMRYAHATIPGLDLGNEDNASGSNNGNEALNFFNLGFDASWEIDLWGGKRRTSEAEHALSQAAEANLADAQVAISAEVASAYVELRQRQQQLRLSEMDLAQQRTALALQNQRLKAGTTHALEVEPLRDQLQRSEADHARLAAERDIYLTHLAVLTGRAPSGLDERLSALSAIPLPPQAVAIGDPAAMLQRRPDIRAAERQYAAATARIGAAEAARFPTISLMGIIGLGGTQPQDMVNIDKVSTIALPQIGWKFLDFGRTASGVERAKGTSDEAAAQYRSAILTALQDSETALSRFAASRSAYESARASVQSARHIEVLQEQKFSARTISRLPVLEARRRVISAEVALQKAQAALTKDFIALQKALGLGWQ